MRLSLRRQIWLTLGPVLALLGVVGVAGTALLQRLGGRVDAILRENYDSVRAMERLNEALDGTDASFHFALAGRESAARDEYERNRAAGEEQFRVAENNVTIFPAEQQLVDRLRLQKEAYTVRAAQFYARPAGSRERETDYFGRDGEPGLLELFREVKQTSGEVLRLNQENMESANREAKATARASVAWLAGGVLLAGVVAGVLTWGLTRSIVTPVGELTCSAQAVSGGRLDLTVSEAGPEELAQLAAAFNVMTRHLRAYRRSNTERLARTQRTAQATIDSFPDPVLVVDPGGRVELTNPAARRLFGVAPSEDDSGATWVPPEPLRRPLDETLHGDRAFLTESFSQSIEFPLDGTDRVYLPQVRPIHDSAGGTLGAAVVLNDVTRFRLLDRLKTDLVATASHELKTPLTGLRLAVHLLLEETVGPLTPKQSELLIDARDNAERLLVLVEQLLDLARLEGDKGAVRPEPVSPAALLSAAAEGVGPRAAAKHIAVSVGPADHLPPVAADPARIGLALANLVNNAVSYTPAGGQVTLSAEPAGDAVTLTVTDTGVGIPPEYLPHVFERFFRVPGQEHHPGTGLGLAIVKEVVTAHGGSVTCESKRGEGTTLRVTLPTWKGEE